ncbi:MAG: 16S rRNA (uracil(1498)-N(3))-methyltransferase [Ferrovibrio sp.]|nr:16S rRNA (uracil(1498)-N(3))-methyltransferase [Ferrovibrio sp.]
MASVARLYVTADLKAGADLALDEAAAHYLRHVLRLEPGAGLTLFNGRDGEFAAELTIAAKRETRVTVGECLRPFQAPRDIWLCFAPIRQGRIEFIIEKATELGAARLLPVLTKRCQVRQINAQRLQAHAREAAEQCERLDVPPLSPLQSLEALLAAWPQERRLFACLEREAATPLLVALQALPTGAPLAMLVGPEGGFAPEEAALLKARAFVTPVSLGAGILRAETAALAALAVAAAL